MSVRKDLDDVRTRQHNRAEGAGEDVGIAIALDYISLEKRDRHGVLYETDYFMVTEDEIWEVRCRARNRHARRHDYDKATLLHRMDATLPQLYLSEQLGEADRKAAQRRAYKLHQEYRRAYPQGDK